MNKWRWTVGLTWLAMVLGLPLAGHRMRHTSEARCVFDGGRIQSLFQVRIVDHQGRTYAFCCLRCADGWLSRQARPPQAVYVTDEASGQEVEAEVAYFVRSSVITNLATGNRTHAFRNQEDAEKHAKISQGTLLAGSEKPFGARK